MALDRRTVDAASGAHIRQLQQVRSVTESEKKEIRRMHEKAAKRAEEKQHLKK